MAKALLGHVGTAPDRRMLEELVFLRSRVRTLQAELDRLRAVQAAAELDLRIPDAPPVRYAEPVHA
ncbi:MAG: hypothetical protein H0V67_12095 [Geodermatophilaceae bacterium]|nr:hypothetical protein [Geodermatophilaceae bacterium]